MDVMEDLLHEDMLSNRFQAALGRTDAQGKVSDGQSLHQGLAYLHKAKD